MCMIYLKRIHNYTAPQNNYFDVALYKNFFIKLFINIICGLPYYFRHFVKTNGLRHNKEDSKRDNR